MTQTRDEAGGEIAHDTLFRPKRNFDVPYLVSSLRHFKNYLATLPQEQLPSTLQEALQQYTSSSEDARHRVHYLNDFIENQNLNQVLTHLETLDNDTQIAEASQSLQILLDQDSAYWFGEGRFEKSLQYGFAGLAQRAQTEDLNLKLKELARVTPLHESFGRDLRQSFNREMLAELALLMGIGAAGGGAMGAFRYLGQRSAAYRIAHTVSRMPGEMGIINTKNGLTFLEAMETSNYLGLRLATGDTVGAFVAGSVANAEIVTGFSNMALSHPTEFGPTLYDLSLLHLIMQPMRSWPGIGGLAARGMIAGPVMTGAAVTRQPLGLGYQDENPLSLSGILHSTFMGLGLETGSHTGLQTLRWVSGVMRPTHGYQEGGPRHFFEQIPEVFGKLSDWPEKLKGLAITLGNTVNPTLISKRVHNVTRFTGEGTMINYWQYLFASASMFYTVIRPDYIYFSRKTHTSPVKKNILRFLGCPESMVAMTGLEVRSPRVVSDHLMQTDHRQATWDFQVEAATGKEGIAELENLRHRSSEVAAGQGDPEAKRAFATAENPDYPARLAQWTLSFLDYLSGKGNKESFQGFKREGVRRYESTFLTENGERLNLTDDAFAQVPDFFNYAARFPRKPLGAARTFLREYQGVQVVDENGQSRTPLPQFKKQTRQMPLDDPSKHPVNVNGPTMMIFAEKLAALLPPV